MVVTGLLELPLEVLEEVASYLKGSDLGRLTLSCRRLYIALSKDITWRNVLEKERVEVREQVKEMASSWVEQQEEEGNLLPGLAKLQYFIGVRMKKNWTTNNCREGRIELGEEVGHRNVGSY